MADLLPFLIIGGVILAVLGAVALNAWYEKKRTEQIGQIADQLGLSFDARHDPSLQQRLTGFSLFQTGRSRKIKNVVFGETEELSVAIFDYQYTTGSGKHQRNHSQTVIVFSGDSLSLPSFELQPENLLHKIGGMLGMKDINFDSHPKFSRMYFLRGGQEEPIRRVFRPEVLELFEQRPGVYVQAGGRQVAYFRSGKRVSPGEFRKLLAEAFELYSLWKTEA